jgi:hypothetical protein
MIFRFAALVTIADMADLRSSSPGVHESAVGFEVATRATSKNRSGRALMMLEELLAE